MEILETLANLMLVYEIAGAIGGILQVVLILLRKTKNSFLLTLGLLLDCISLSGMSCGHIIQGEPLYAVLDLVTVVIDVTFILYILYREEHPKDKKN